MINPRIALNATKHSSKMHRMRSILAQLVLINDNPRKEIRLIEAYNRLRSKNVFVGAEAFGYLSGPEEKPDMIDTNGYIKFDIRRFLYCMYTTASFNEFEDGYTPYDNEITKSVIGDESEADTLRRIYGNPSERARDLREKGIGGSCAGCWPSAASKIAHWVCRGQ
jgi:hypothetical protein